jgi:cullin 3
LKKEREMIVDACVVRCMKARKIMKHNDIINDVLKLITNFKPEISMIKRRIESLIERDYLRRDEKDR